LRGGEDQEVSEEKEFTTEFTEGKEKKD